MLKFIPYVIKGLWGHRTRTMLTVSGTAGRVVRLLFVNAVQNGLNRLTQSDKAQRTLIVFQENRFCPQSSKLPQDYVRWLSKQPGLDDVIPIKVFTNNCRASLDAVVFHGLPSDKLQETRDVNLIEGNWANFEQRTDAAIVGVDIANRRGVQVGENSASVASPFLFPGIFRAAEPSENNLIYSHLDFLQRARGADEVGTVTQMELRLADNANAENVASSIDQHFRGGPIATTTRTQGTFQTDTLADLAELIGFIHWLGYAMCCLVLALVGTTTVMSVQDRIKEHGILQTIGLRPKRIFQLILLESTLLSFVGGMVGVGLGYGVLISSGWSIAAEGVTLAFEPTPQLLMLGVLVATTIGLLAGLVPAIQASRMQIVSALRHAE